MKKIDRFAEPTGSDSSETISPRDKAKQEYDELEKTLLRRASDKPEGALDLSLDELNVIVNWTRYRTQDEPIHEFWSDEYKDHFDKYDTFLYDQESLTGRDYKLGDLGVVQGGHLNYLAVGMLAAHYGANHYQAIPAMVISHNVDQAIRRRSTRDFKDIGPGTKWALFGAAQYQRGSQ